MIQRSEFATAQEAVDHVESLGYVQNDSVWELDEDHVILILFVHQDPLPYHTIFLNSEDMIEMMNVRS